MPDDVYHAACAVLTAWATFIAAAPFVRPLCAAIRALVP
jgi:hypothetical protein